MDITERLDLASINPGLPMARCSQIPDSDERQIDSCLVDVQGSMLQHV